MRKTRGDKLDYRLHQDSMRYALIAIAITSSISIVALFLAAYAVSIASTVACVRLAKVFIARIKSG